MDTLIIFSHLRWDFVYQRPQHLLSRIASQWRVVFVEEPLEGAGELQVTAPAPGVTVLRPRTPLPASGFEDAQTGAIAPLLRDYLARNGIKRYGVWLYTPMALPLLCELTPEVIIYDCMDELSAFKDAPPQLLARESTLLQIAGVVFTGGPALYDAKRGRSGHVYCLPSSVDAAHFARGVDASIASGMFDGLPRPRLGYYGVVDERVDLALLADLADAEPGWQVCVVGPVAKIDPVALPQRANLRYFPQQPYEALPAILAAWDVCLLPFALNTSTRFISPTKTLEYMSAGKPVVSTAITDVHRLYASGVEVAHDTNAFVAGCRAALHEDAGARQQRARAQATLVGATSWDGAAQRVITEIGRAHERGLSARAREYLSGRQVVSLIASSEDRRREDVACLIVGAGPTGLSAAYHYGSGSLTIDANARVGGWCRSIEDQGFVFDHAGHIMFSKDPDVLALYEKLLGDNLHWQDREAWVYSKGVHTRYPFQAALHGLPPDVLKECLVGAIEARFGPLDGKAPWRACEESDAGGTADCCADGVGIETLPAGDVKDECPQMVVREFASGRTPRNFEEFIYQVWGAGVAKHFAIPYNRKLWTVPLREMETSWLGGRVPLPDLGEMIEGALQPAAKPMGPNARFGYPLRGGFQALMDGFLPHLAGELRLSTRMTALDSARRIATFSDGSEVAYDTLISTISLPELVRMLGNQAPEHVRNAARGLRHVSVRCVNLGIARAGITNKHWIYYPEDTVFHRIFMQGNASPHNSPANGFGLTCEITYSPTKPLPCDDAALIQLCVDDCRRVGVLRDDDRVIAVNTVDMPYAYVIYDHGRADNVARIRKWLASRDILLAGRYSEWEYYNSDHAFIAGRNAAMAAQPTGDTGTQRA